MKTILCYGDSNTWGCIPIRELEDMRRFSKAERWPGVLQRELGAEYEVIEEGNGGRTTVWDDPIEGPKNGKDYLGPCLDSHQPLDLVIIMLGTNDLKVRFSVPASDIAKGAGVLVDIAQRRVFYNADWPPPKVLLMAPPPVLDDDELPEFFQEMFERAGEKSRKFGRYYQEIAEQYGCDFLDTSQVIVSSPVDGVHFDLEEHQKLGKAVAEKVREILG
jgi:lysophospholipase L1-like esterase